jgi:hypothetical protein
MGKIALLFESYLGSLIIRASIYGAVGPGFESRWFLFYILYFIFFNSIFCFFMALTTHNGGNDRFCARLGILTFFKIAFFLYGNQN